MSEAKSPATLAVDASATQPAAVDDPRVARREARRASIVATAWEIATEEGLAAISLHEVARRIGLRQPSLYAYISSKIDLYDQMFAEGYEMLIQRVAAVPRTGEAREDLRALSRAVIDFSVEDIARQQLMFQRTIPGFTPSPRSFALAQQLLHDAADALEAAGVTDPADVDVYTALIAGLTSQQIANDPGGSRWTQHLDRLLDLLLDNLLDPETSETRSP